MNKKQPKPITPEKQKFLDRCNKRTKTLIALENRRRVKKVGFTFIPSDYDAPCAFMVERKEQSEK
jgi:hypothetical protein